MASHEQIEIAELKVDVYRPERREPKATLLFCHGFWVGGWIWEEFARYFADLGYSCYVPTWRGHYDSKPVPDLGQVSVFDYVEDALAVARAVSPDALIGESLGGLIAQKVAEALPNIKALALMNPVPPFMVRANLKVVRSQFKYMGDLLGRKPNLPQEEDYKMLVLNNMDEPEASEFYKKICPDSGRALLEVSMGKVKVDVNKIRCPVYIAIGHLDVLLPVKIHRKIARLYGAQVAEYPSMSHHTFGEQGWENVADELDTWLSEKVAGAGPLT